jgi:type IV secretion system protein VirB10
MKSLFRFPIQLFWICLLTPLGFGQHPADAAQPDPELEVPAGTDIPIALTTYLNSRSSQVGDSFYAETVYPIWIQQRMVIPRGSVVKGTVTDVERPGRIKGKGRLAIRLDSILLPNGVRRDLNAAFKGIHGPGTEKLDRQTEMVEIDSTVGTDTKTVAGTTATGAVIGAMADHSLKGAGIGAGVGGAAGIAAVFLSRGRDLVLSPGTQFDIELRQPIRFAYGELDFRPADLNNSRRYTPNRPPIQHNRQSRSWLRGFGRWGIPWLPFRR